MNPLTELYDPAIPEGLCRYEPPTTVALFASNLSSDVSDAASQVETATGEANDYVTRELERIKPLLQIGSPLTNTDSCRTAQEFRDRDIDILLSLKYCGEIQDKYRSVGIDVTRLVAFVEGVKQQLIALLSTSPLPQFLN